VTLTFDLDIQ